MKFVLKLLLIANFTLLLSANISEEGSSIESVYAIKKDIDNLVSNIEVKTTSTQNTAVNKSKADFTSEIFDAFQSLNQDFIEYDNLVTGKNTVKIILNPKIKNDNTTTKKDFYSQADELSKQVELAVESIAKIEKNEENVKKIQAKLNYLGQMKKQLQKIGEKIKIIKGKKEEVHTEIDHVRNAMKNLINLYQKYFNSERELRSSLQRELFSIASEYDNSVKKSVEINKYSEFFNRVESFYSKLQLDNKHRQKEKYQQYFSLISQIKKLDQVSIGLKNQIKHQIMKMYSIERKQLNKTKIKRLEKVLFILRNLKAQNKQIISIKKVITKQLKDISFTNLNDLLAFIQNKKQMTEEKRQKIIHLKNALTIGHKIFKEAGTIKNVKKRIMNNINEVEENIEAKGGDVENDNLNNQTYDKSEIAKIHNSLVNKFLSIHMYLKQIKKLRKVFTGKKEKLQFNQVNDKIIKYKRFLVLLRILISNSKKISKILKNRNKTGGKFRVEFAKLIKKIHRLKREINLDNYISSERIEHLRTKLSKLYDLYEYLKQGSIHNFVRSELMKKLLNVNESITHDLDIKKMLMQVKLSQ